MFTLQAFTSDTLAADITDSATSATLTTGAFGTPTGEQMLVIDYDVAAKREIVKCAIDGTGVTSIDRAQDGTAAVAHSSGAKVIMAFVPSHYTAKADVAQEDFIAPTLTNSWVNYGEFAGAGYRKDTLGLVHLKGLVKGGATNNSVFTLPVGYRPAEKMLFSGHSTLANSYIEINTDGTIVPSFGSAITYLDLSAITFKAA